MIAFLLAGWFIGAALYVLAYIVAFVWFVARALLHEQPVVPKAEARERYRNALKGRW